MVVGLLASRKLGRFKKAFDRLAWEYMAVMLSAVGFRTKMRNRILALCVILLLGLRGMDLYRMLSRFIMEQGRGAHCHP